MTSTETILGAVFIIESYEFIFVLSYENYKVEYKIFGGFEQAVTDARVILGFFLPITGSNKSLWKLP